MCRLIPVSARSINPDKRHVAGQAGKPQFLPFLTVAINCSFRFSNSFVRFKDSLADNFNRGGRSIFSSFKSFNLLAIFISEIYAPIRLFIVAWQACPPMIDQWTAVKP